MQVVDLVEYQSGGQSGFGDESGAPFDGGEETPSEDF